MENVEQLCHHCGREYRPHCPSCGSYRHYALASRLDKITDNNGQTRILKVYRCMACGNVYNDDGWMLNCLAQPERLGRPRKDEVNFTKGMLGRPGAKMAEEDLPQHQKDILTQLRKMRGLE